MRDVRIPIEEIEDRECKEGHLISSLYVSIHRILKSLRRYMMLMELSRLDTVYPLVPRKADYLYITYSSFTTKEA